MNISWGHRLTFGASQQNLWLLNLWTCVNDYTARTSPEHSCFQVHNYKVWCRAQCTWLSILWHWSHCTLWTWLHHFWQAMPNGAVKSMVINDLHHLSATPTCGITSLKQIPIWGICDQSEGLPLTASDGLIRWVVNMSIWYPPCLAPFWPVSMHCFSSSLIVPCTNNCSPKLKDIAVM